MNYIKIDYEYSERFKNKVLNGNTIPKWKYDNRCNENYYEEKWWKELNDTQKELILLWLDETFKPIKSINTRHTSYEIKHFCENEVGFYVNNDVIKKAMILKGYEIMPDRLNWFFNISEKFKLNKGKEFMEKYKELYNRKEMEGKYREFKEE